MGAIIARLDEKRNLQKILGENFQKFSAENCEKCIILADFSPNLRTYALIFLRVWTKKTIYWKFRENFRKFFQKISLENY